jgi:hypothetical protein
VELDTRTLVRLHALGRAAVGAAFTLAPKRAARTWIGRQASRPDATVLSMAFGGRDLGIALGILRATTEGHGARPWIQAGVLADAIDFAGTYRARHGLPASAAGVLLIASGSAFLGAWLQGRID